MNDYVAPPRRDAEIDLLALCGSLWTYKFLILGVTLFIFACSTLYAMLATPVYQVESVLRPVALKHLDELNGTKLMELSPANALQQVGVALESYSIRLQFLRDNPELTAALQIGDEPLEQVLERLNRDGFTVLRPDLKKAPDSSPFVGLRFAFPAGVDGVAIVNGLVGAAVERERQRIQDDFSVLLANRLAQVESKIAAQRAAYDADKEAKIAVLLEADRLQKVQLEDELRALRQQLLVRRQNRIKQLNEAIQIAERLHITKPTTPSALGDSQRETQGSIFRTEVNNQQIPLYFMGVEALEAERSALIARQSDDFSEPRISEIQKQLTLLAHNREVEVLRDRANEELFLANLAALTEQRARLEHMKVDFSKLQLVQLDQSATTPSAPVRPRKLLIMALGLIIGAAFGVGAALVAVLRRGRPVVREERSLALSYS
ncbi:chain-length determining protein [Pseudomonas sp. LA21]|uniref:Wzz/FepE/Etk N-terminal domain-containing protein n=1 Tax=unclassified Pseudomonas TaxID=196821 RepID=UPI001FB5E1D5|nr:Wzz/FepE/Etk N-terminal domain-containing protein [Pseudomonas sp. LA21]MCJ1885653.1 chain-length determining protein [Pseudomonas sp. LA21]